MTWHLKDRELERVLEKYSDGNFVKALNFAIERDWIDAANVVTVEFERKFLSRGYTNDFSFRTDELEEVPEYNPHTWNLYPKVTPPQGAMMRIKYHDVTSKDRKVERGFALFDCGQWVSDSGYPKFPNNPQNYVIWFRPWIGPDEEGEE